MATAPASDPHPDSPPAEPEDTPDSTMPSTPAPPDVHAQDRRRSPMEDAGTDGGTAGTGGQFSPNGHDITS